MWDVNTGECMNTLSGHTNWVFTIIQLTDGRVVSGSGDNTLKVREINMCCCYDMGDW